MTDRDPDPWSDLRRLTTARIGLPRAGASLATGPLLEFQLAHARARDAVHAPFDQARLQALLDAECRSFALPVLCVASAAADRQTYLMRPDLGRTLALEAPAVLSARAARYDLAIVVTDGLSAGAVEAHAPPLLAAVLPALLGQRWTIAPLVIVRHGRVAIGDAVAAALGADIVVVLIGERPGLSAPDSMGAYLTWQPGQGTTDADRNCLSNIRPAGIFYTDAAFKLIHLLGAMRACRLSGVRLKDDSDGLFLADV